MLNIVEKLLLFPYCVEEVNNDFIDDRNALGAFLCALSDFGDSK